MTDKLVTFSVFDTNDYGVSIDGCAKGGTIVYLSYSFYPKNCVKQHSVFLSSEENKELVYQIENRDKPNRSSKIVELDKKNHRGYLSKCGCYSEPPEGMKYYTIEYTDLETGFTFLEDYLKT